MKIHLTTEDTSRMMEDLCNQVLPFQNQFETVVGIKRGGLNVSHWLAYTLNKKHDEVEISFYGDGKTPKDSPDHVWVGTSYLYKPFLLVDDIVDSGRTIRLFRELSTIWKPTFFFAALHWCEENSPCDKPDFFVEKKKKEDWIVYPWPGGD